MTLKILFWLLVYIISLFLGSVIAEVKVTKGKGASVLSASKKPFEFEGKSYTPEAIEDPSGKKEGSDEEEEASEDGSDSGTEEEEDKVETGAGEGEVQTEDGSIVDVSCNIFINYIFLYYRLY